MASAPASAGGAGAGTWAGPAIQAGGQIAGAVVGGKGAKAAAETQLQGTREALAFQQRQENDRKAAFNKSVARYEQQVAAWNANRSVLAERYGIDIGSPSTGIPSGGQPETGQPTTPGQPPAGDPAGNYSLGDLAGRKPWNEWSTYGLGR